jgi:ornithine cyclodeaminase/alanine dehydrogenase-like protein (mu-crystallin family)
VDLIGSYTPKMREADNALFRGARVIVDTRDAIVESGDLIDPCSDGSLDATTIKDISELIHDPTLGRRKAEEITIFKAVGTATSDLAAAEYLVGQHNASHSNSTDNTDTLQR